jgi:hypothetical protein
MFDELFKNAKNLGYKTNISGIKWTDIIDIEDKIKKKCNNNEEIEKKLLNKLIKLQNKNYFINKKSKPYLFKKILDKNFYTKIDILKLHLYKWFYTNELQEGIVNYVDKDKEVLRKISKIYKFKKIIFNKEERIFSTYIDNKNYKENKEKIDKDILKANMLLHNMIGKKINFYVNAKFQDEMGKSFGEEYKKFKSLQII